MEIRRRQFLKSIGIAGVGFMVLNPVLEAFAKTGSKAGTGAKSLGQWIPSTCHGCTSWCPNELYQQTTGGIKRAVKARGNQLSVCNPGMLCPKGHMAISEGYDPDRLRTPLMRTNAKGPGIVPDWQPISWDAAITALATKMMDLRTAGTPEKFLFMRGRYTPYTTDIIKSALPKIYGSPNQFTHSTLCAEAEKMGPYFTEGIWGYRDYDLEKTKYLLLWGVDPFRSNRMPPRAMQRWDTVRNNATVVVVDPCLTGAAASAVNSKTDNNNNKWHPIIPGTDGALASALAHHILVQGLWYKPFVGDFNGSGVSNFAYNTPVAESAFTETYTYGLIKWWNTELLDKTPAWAAAITGISQSDIEQMADEMGSKAPNVISWQGPGATMTPRGAYTSMAIQALNGLLGSTRNIGGPMIQPSKAAGALPSVTSYQDATATTGYAKEYVDKRGHELNQPFIDKTIGAANSIQAAADHLLDGSAPYDIDAALIYYNNVCHSATEAKRFDDLFTTGVPHSIPWMAHITTHASETSQFADILMPAAFGTEKWGVLTSSANRFTEMTLMQPVATRLFDVKDEETEIPWLLALKLQSLGFSKYYEYLSTKFPDPETNALPTNEDEFAEIAAKFFAYPSYNGQGDTWATWKLKGVSSSTQSQYMYQWGNMATKTKKFEFYSETLKKELRKHAADSYQKVMTVTLTGTSGTANINIAGTDYLATFASSLTATATAFKAAWAATLLSLGITVTSSGANIVLTAVVFGADFAALAPVNASGDLAGTIATTVAPNLTPHWTGKTVDDVMEACNYEARGEFAFVPHYESPYRIGDTTNFPFTFIDGKSRFNREGRSQNNPLYYQFKKLDPGDNNWGDCIKINPVDAASLGVVNGDQVWVTSAVNSTGVKVTVKLYEGIRPGTVAKTYGQGHWAYGRFAADFANLTENPGAGSNNAFMPHEFERLSGANVRNGGFCGVQLVKVV